MVLWWILKPGKPESHMQPLPASRRQLALGQSHSFICLELQEGAFCLQITEYMGLPWWLSGRESSCQCRRCKSCGFNPWLVVLFSFCLCVCVLISVFHVISSPQLSDMLRYLLIFKKKRKKLIGNSEQRDGLANWELPLE